MNNKRSETSTETNFGMTKTNPNLTQTPQRHPYELCKLYDCEGNIKKRWVIEYYVYNRDVKKKVRRRISGINRIKTLKERREAAKELMQEINQLLIQGYTEGGSQKGIFQADTQVYTLKEAFTHFLLIKDTAIKKNTAASYRSTQRIFCSWLDSKGLGELALGDFNVTIAYSFFDYLKTERKCANKTYNNYLINLNSIFNFYVSREIIAKNPLDNLSQLKTESGKHVPFTNAQIKRIKERIQKKGDTQLLLFISFLYYTLARPREEVRLLQVRDLREKTIFIPSARSKNNKGGHIIIPPPLEQLIEQYKLRDYPPHYYIFTLKGVPGEKHVGKDYFYLRHRQILKELKLTDQAYDLYGWKHTGVINLFSAGADIKAIQQQCRHSTIGQTDRYMKDLGLIRNEEMLSKFPEL